MRNINDLTMCMVEYETDVSVVREFMSNLEFQKLLNEERNGNIRIMSHTELGFAKKA